jgi:sortase A
VSVRRGVRGVGKVLVGTGLLVVLFVGYQLWGTGFAERRGQRALRAQLEQRQAPPATGSSAAAPAPVDLGDAVGLIEIPALDLTKRVIEGVGVEELKSAPGHYPGTPLPGQRGNAAIAGHRTTYGAPFYDLDALGPGDAIFVTTDAGRFRYEVTGSIVVDPVEGGWVLDPTDDDRLTLTTCNPRLSAAQRLIVTARLMSAPSEAPAPTVTPVASLEVGADLSRQPGHATAGLAWGAVAAAVWLAARVWSRRARRRWAPYVLALTPFLVALFLFYDSVARLLPADV